MVRNGLRPSTVESILNIDLKRKAHHRRVGVCLLRGLPRVSFCSENGRTPSGCFFSSGPPKWWVSFWVPFKKGHTHIVLVSFSIQRRPFPGSPDLQQNHALKRQQRPSSVARKEGQKRTLGTCLKPLDSLTEATPRTQEGN